MRRLVGFLLMLLTLQVSLAGADLGCAGHHGGSRHTTKVASSSDAHAHHAQSAQTHCQETDSCESPHTPGCCGALAGCATTVLGAASHASGPVLRFLERPSDAAGFAPLWGTAPETPPPRA